MSKKSKPFLAHSELTDCIYIIDGNDKYEVTEQCISAMKATNRMPRWIPVSERLPEIHNFCQLYLVTYKQGQICTAFYTETNGRSWWSIDGVEAWMPLPEPYKSEIPTGEEGSDKE